MFYFLLWIYKNIFRGYILKFMHIILFNFILKGDKKKQLINKSL